MAALFVFITLQRYLFADESAKMASREVEEGGT